MKHITLRLQIIAVVATLAIGVLAALYYVATATDTARESILRLNRERLSTLGENLARRYGSVIGFIATEQFSDSSLAEREELTTLIRNITREELSEAQDIQSGFYHSLWNREVSSFPASPRVSFPPAIAQVLQLQIASTLTEGGEQWNYTETGGANILLLTKPVFARRRTVGVVWLSTVLNTEFAPAWPGDIVPIVLLTILVGIAIAAVFLVNLRREVNRIQQGLTAMRGNIATRLPASSTELGHISASINGLAETIVRQQEEREQLQRAIQHKEKLASLGQLIAGVAHEIRTPLPVIKTRVQIWQRQHEARSEPADGEDSTVVSSETMRMVVDELNRIERIVRKLLYFSRQRGRNIRTISLADLLQQALASLSEEFRKHAVLLDLHVSPVPNVRIDEAEIREVLLNLITNALEAMPSGGVLTVTMISDPESAQSGFRVQNSGAPIDPIVARSMFDPFFTTKETGTGLGLSIAYEIVRSHGGSLEFETGPAGTAFTVLLPQDVPSQQRQEPGR